MRVLLIVTIPNEPFNSLVKKGIAGKTMKKILDELKPEAAYFTELAGKRTGILVVDLADPSKIPSLAEPFFLLLNAEVQIRPTMTSADLMKADIDALGKKWR
jgi:hypothetical protein